MSLEANVTIAPGTAVTAQSDASVLIRKNCSLLPGVLIEAVAGPKVTGREGAVCSVFLGDRVTLAHKAIIHSPAFIGEGCFVGFRSTIYNARLGSGCVVMMHALIQDVEVPPGKCVPSGSVITTQHQADQLPNARPEDLAFAKEIAESSPRSSARSASSARSRLVPIRSESSAQPSSGRSDSTRSAAATASRSRPAAQFSNTHQSTPNSSYDTEGANMQTQRLSPEIVQQVRGYLAQGYRIGMEHADQRRYRSNVWETCTPIKDTREQAVFEALERCLAEHSGEYVRMFGIDPQAKRRVGMVTVQRPDGKAVTIDSKPAAGAANNSFGGNSASYSSSSYGSSESGNDSGGLTANVVERVRSLLRSGFIIGTEHADQRRYRSNVWKSCSPIQSTNERDVLAHLEHCLTEHSGEYVRMFGIDPQANRRIAAETIQRADGTPVDDSGNRQPAVSASRNQAYGASQGATQSGYSAQGGGSGAIAQSVNQILGQGNQVGVEIADARRYRSGIWQTAPTVQSANQLQNFLSQHPDKYVRIFGVNNATKTRGSATTIQKPNQRTDAQASQSQSDQSGSSQDPINANPPHYDDPKFLNRNNSQGYGGSSNQISSGYGGSNQDKVSQILSQGNRIGVEVADARRYRSGIWQTAPTVKSASQLQSFLGQNSDKYVRIFSVDKTTKTRGSSTTIQKPGQQTNGQFSQNAQDPINANPPHYDDPKFINRNNSKGYGGSNNHASSGYGSSQGNGGGALESEIMNQVTQLVNQGCRIAIEYADKRRFRSGIWQTGPSIDARRPAEAISALGKQLAAHSGDYVRLVGVDPQAKRRVLETTIQRP